MGAFDTGEQARNLLEEAAPLVRRLLAGEQVTHAGRYFTLTGALPPPVV